MPERRTRRRLFGQWTTLAALGLLSALPLAAQSQAYPCRPIRLVVPFTPGRSTDILARAIGLELGKACNASVVAENMPGAGGAIGADKVAKAAPDGYALLMGHIGTLAVNPSLYPRLPYNPVKDFAPVAWVANVRNVLVLHPSTKAANMKEFVAYAQANPGRLNYGSGGNGSAANLASPRCCSPACPPSSPRFATASSRRWPCRARLNQAINAALHSAELKKRLGAEGAVANPTTPEAFGKYIASEIERWKPVITSGRVKVD